MSQTERWLGKKLRQIGKENREKIFLTIAKEPLTFSELLDETDVSRATLSKHLKDLQKKGLIERAISGERIVYKLSQIDEETILAELKVGFFDSSLEILSRIFPSIKEGVEMYLKSLAQMIVQYQKDVNKYGEEDALRLAQKRFEERSKSQKPLKPLEIIEAPKQGEDE